MPATHPSETKVVIVGGGVVGASVAYHLTRLGWKDVVLLEPKELAIALAKGAQSRGATIIENVRVLDVLHHGGRATGVRVQPSQSPISNHQSITDLRADYVVLCGGMWTRQLGLRCGVTIPLYPVEHHYVVTEPLPGAFDELPVGRDPDLCIYFRGEGHALMLGAFQNFSKAWMVEKIPDKFCFQLLEPDWEKF